MYGFVVMQVVNIPKKRRIYSVYKNAWRKKSDEQEREPLRWSLFHNVVV